MTPSVSNPKRGACSFSRFGGREKYNFDKKHFFFFVQVPGNAGSWNGGLSFQFLAMAILLSLESARGHPKPDQHKTKKLDFIGYSIWIWLPRPISRFQALSLNTLRRSIDHESQREISSFHLLYVRKICNFLGTHAVLRVKVYSRIKMRDNKRVERFLGSEREKTVLSNHVIIYDTLFTSQA